MNLAPLSGRVNFFLFAFRNAMSCKCSVIRNILCFSCPKNVDFTAARLHASVLRGKLAGKLACDQIFM